MLSCRSPLRVGLLLATSVLFGCGGSSQAPPESPPPDTKTQACALDEKGWTTPRPTAADLSTGLQQIDQPGSRLYYMDSASGSDQTGEIYFWNGHRIIDSRGREADGTGLAYGIDPMQPSRAVKPFKRWAYVGPRSNGADIGQRGVVGAPSGGTRAGYPDWWLFARGRTYDLADDLLSFERETNPDATTVPSSLMVPGGRSASERQVVGAYGDPCQPRPRFVHPLLGFVTEISKPSSTLKHVAYLSLHFDGHDRPNGVSGGGATLLYQTAASVDILFEDIWFDAAMVNIGGNNAGSFTFRRVLITDSYSPDGKAHVQGLYYEGARDGQLRIEESILLRNGFRGEPKAMPWPPAGDQVWNIYNRNLYLHGEADSMNSGLFDSVSMLGASGDQIRPGMRVERNFFYQGYVTMGAHGGYPDSAGPTGTLTDNVLQRFVAKGTRDDRGHPGWGFGLTSGAYEVEVARNIVTGAQHPSDEPALQLSPLAWPCYAHVYRHATRSNHVHGNIFDSAGGSAVGVEIGVTGESPPGCSNYTGNGVTGNRIENNVMLSAIGSEAVYTLKGDRLSHGDPSTASFTGNHVYRDRASAASARGWPAPERTLKSYLQSKGIAVHSSDGFPEYFAQAVQQRRGRWDPDWNSRTLVNYFRKGYAMQPLE